MRSFNELHTTHGKYIKPTQMKYIKRMHKKLVTISRSPEGGAHLPIAHALHLLFLDEIEIEKK